MPIYRYRAVTEKGAVVEGSAPAESRLALWDELTSNGLFPSSIRRSRFFRSVRASEEDLLFFVSELETLVRSGIPIPEALETIADSPKSTSVLATANRVHADVLKGSRLSAAVSRHPLIFDALFCGLVRIGEKSGELASALAEYHRLLERRLMLKRKAAQALAYPAFILMLATAIVAVLLFFSLPRFTALYSDLGADLPGPTRGLLSLMEWLSAYGWVAGSAVLSLLLTLRYGLSGARRRAFYERIVRVMPLTGEMQNAYALSLSCYSLRSLMARGMSVVDACRSTADVAPTLKVSRALTRVAERVEQGSGLVQALKSEDVLESSTLKLIDAGVRAGSIEMQLGDVAAYYDRLFDYRMTRLLALFEPVLVLVTGLIVGAAVVAMYLPIFGMAGAL